MSSYSFYPGTPSFLAMKYLRTYTPSTQLQPGERYRLRRNMEAKVHGYSDISRELRCVSEEIEHQRFKSPEREMAPPTWLRNSAVGYTTQKAGGNQWIYSHYPTNIRFSRATTPILTSCGKDRMDSVYRYYGTHRY